MKKFVFASLLFLSCFSVVGQNNYEMPKIKPPSPEAQNFLRYGEVPVDISTGIPGISVPIYNVTSRKLQFPITASYHASGIKVSDRSSVIGLGWVLNIKGMLNITALGIMNYDLVLQPTYKTALDFNNAKAAAAQDGSPNWYNFIIMMEDQQQGRDWQSDRFNFRLPTGLSGVFRYDFITGNLIKIPFGSYKVQKSVNSFKITDDNGDDYTFGYPPGTNNNYNFQSMELLTIISADKTDTIRFVYKPGAFNTYEQAAFGTVLETGDEPVTGSLSPNYIPTATLSKAFNRSTTSERVLDSIITATTIVKVISIGDRADMGFYPNGHRVSSIEVYSRWDGMRINEINFHQSYFGSLANKNQRLRLDGIGIKGSSATTYNTYSFDYENAIQLPQVPEDDVTMNPVFSEDYWGYFNNSGSYSKIPQEFIPSTTFTSPYTGASVSLPSGAGTNRNPDHYYAKAALIKSIKYPTGGKTVFEFEPNHAVNAYSYPGVTSSAGFVGGFRIHKIKNYTDQTTLAETKTYQYSDGYTRTISSDLYIYHQRIFKMVSVGYVGDPRDFATSVTHEITSSSPFLPLTYGQGPPVFYEKVTEYVGDASNNVGKTEYTYLWPKSSNHASADHPRFQNHLEQDYGTYSPILAQKISYKSLGNGLYSPVQKVANEYSTFKEEFYPVGLHLVHTSSYPYGNRGLDTYGYVINGVQTAPFQDYYFSTIGTNNYYQVFDLSATQAIDLLTKTEVTSYDSDPNKKLITTTSYNYDILTHLQPIEQKVIDSKGDEIKTTFTYPINYSGNSTYDNMIARNIISPVISQSRFRNNTFLSSSKSNYFPWATNFFAPQTVESKTGVGPIDTRLRFHSFDEKGNLLSVSKENDVKKSYIWAYNRTVPIAEAENANHNEIFYESFEENSGWQNTLSALDNTKAHSGRYSGRIDKPTAGEQVSHPSSWMNLSLSGATKFKYSGWVYSNGPSVEMFIIMQNASETGYYTYYDNVVTFTTNQWVFIEKEFTMPADVTKMIFRVDNNGGGSVWFDDLRLHPASSQMTTQTYNPLVGITSQGDVNNRYVFYEYDDFNRLKLIRDQENKVLKIICYNYAGQPEDCQFPCENTTADWQNTNTAVRCKQVGGQNTGYQEQEQRDMNPCSPTYNQILWTTIGYNASACPLPPPCNSGNCTGNDKNASMEFARQVPGQ